MSYSTSLLLLPQTDQSKINKNFLVGEKVPGAGHILNGKNVHTATWKLSNFKGLIRFQATLVQEPSESDWFDAYQIDARTNPLTEIKYANIEGNYIWIRIALFQFTGGVVQYIKVSY